MFKVCVYSLCSFFILISGLVSCSQDRTTVLQPDPFKADGLTSQRADRSYQLGKDITSLEVKGELTLTSLLNKDFAADPILFTINTECTDILHNRSYRKEYRQKNSAVFPVVKLLPEEILLLTQSFSVQCDFTLTAQNTLTSTSTSQLTGVEIAGLENFSNWDLGFLNNNASVYENDKAQLLASANDTSTLRLQCDEFGAFKKADSKDLSLEELVGESLSLPLQSITQKCRLLRTLENNLSLSPVFKLQMPMLPLALNVNFPKLDIGVQTFRQRDVLQMRIYNPNTFSLKIKIPKGASGLYLFQPVRKEGYDTLFLGEAVSRPITWRTPLPESIVSSENDFLVVLIEAKKDILVIGQVDLNLLCNDPATTFANTPALIGNTMDFQIENIFSVRPYDGAEMALDIPLGSPKYYSAFTGLRFWDISESDGLLIKNLAQVGSPYFNCTTLK